MGRRPKDNHNISITDLKVNFISQKKDNYGNDVIYWKCMENSKLKALTYLKEKDENLRMPYFIGENGNIILKCKLKFVNQFSPEIEDLKRMTYIIDAKFESYCFEVSEDEFINGYYMKVSKLEKSPVQVV